MRVTTTPASRRGTGFYVLYDVIEREDDGKGAEVGRTEVCMYRPTLEAARQTARFALRQGSPSAVILQTREHLTPRKAGKDAS